MTAISSPSNPIPGKTVSTQRVCHLVTTKSHEVVRMVTLKLTMTQERKMTKQETLIKKSKSILTLLQVPVGVPS